MKKIITLLDLAADADEGQICKAIKAKLAELAKVEVSVKRLESANKKAASAVADLRAQLATATAAAPVGTLAPLPDETAIRAKISSGLTRDQAIAVLGAQVEHDATSPHDPVPELVAEDVATGALNEPNPTPEPVELESATEETTASE